MRLRTLPGVIIAIIVVLTGLAGAQSNPEVKIKKVAPSQTSPASGQQMYLAYCASCHGTSAKGDGPAAPALKPAPTDLTALAKQNKGTFPSNHVQTILKGGAVTAHGSQDMPVWGPIFRSMSGGFTPAVELRIHNLSKYLESVQTN